MNQIFKPAPRDRTRYDGEPFSGIAFDIRDRLAGRVEYDDGEPATILPADRRPGTRVDGRFRPAAVFEKPARDDTRAGARSHIRPVGGTGRGASFRAPLAAVTGASAVEYDDGNPATVAPERD